MTVGLNLIGSNVYTLIFPVWLVVLWILVVILLMFCEQIVSHQFWLIICLIGQFHWFMCVNLEWAIFNKIDQQINRCHRSTLESNYVFHRLYDVQSTKNSVKSMYEYMYITCAHCNRICAFSFLTYPLSKSTHVDHSNVSIGMGWFIFLALF